MNLTYDFDENDFLNFQTYFRGLEMIGWLILEVISIIVGCVVAVVVHLFTTDLQISLIWFVMILLIANLLLFSLLWLLAVIKLRSARKQQLFGQIDLKLTPEGFHLYNHQLAQKSEAYQGHFQKWALVKQLKESKDYFFLSLGLGRVFIVPKRTFGTQDDLQVFRDNVHSWI